jgi:hypothetical protein
MIACLDLQYFCFCKRIDARVADLPSIAAEVLFQLAPLPPEHQQHAAVEELNVLCFLRPLLLLICTPFLVS